MGMSDGSIIFKTKIDDSGMSAGLKKIKAELDGLKSSLDSDKNSLKSLQFELKKAESNSRSLYNTWEKGGFKDNNIKKALSEADGEAKRLRETISKIQSRISGTQSKLALTKKQFSNAQKAEKTNTSSNGGFSLKAVGGGSLKAIKALFGFNSGQRQAIPLAKQLSGSIFSLGNMFKLLALRMAMRQVLRGIAEGFGNATQYSSALKSSIESLQISTGALANGLGAMLAPLLNAIAPVLSQIIDWFTAGANTIAHFFAVLTGAKQYIIAKKSLASVTSEQKKGAKAAKGATKALKEEQGALAGIDEINDISAKSNSGGGSGSGGAGSGADVNSMFDTVDTNPLEGIWKQIKDGDWKGLGQALGNNINEAFASIDWAGIGETAGQGLNGVIQTLYYILKTVDFKAIGKDFATLFNKAIGQVDFNTLGRLLIRKTTAMFDMLIGFFGNLDYKLIAKAISAFLIGGFDEMTEWLRSYDWSKVGSDIVDGISDFFSNLDVGGIVSSFLTFLTTALLSLGSLIGEAIEKVCDNIYNYFKGFIEQQDYGDVGTNIIMGILEGIWNVIKGVGTWIWNNVCKPIIEAVKNFFGIHSPSTVFAELGGFLMQGMLNGIKAVWETISSWFNSAFEGLKNFISNIWNSITQTTSSVWNGIGKIFSNTWNGIKSIWGGVSAFFGGVWQGIKNVFSNVASWFGSVFGNAWQAVKNVFSAGGAIFKGITQSIANVFKGTVNSLINGINNVVAVPFNSINWALGKLRDVNILGGRPFGWIPSIGVPRIPHLAKGAVIPANHEFLAVLGDQKHGTNIEAPLETIQDALRVVMDEKGSGNDDVVKMLATLIRVVQEKHILVEDVGKSAVSYIVEETNRTGENPVLILE